MWNRVVRLIIKEVLSLWSDKRVRAILMIPPFLQLFLFAFAATLDVKNVPIGILNLDNGARSIELIERTYGSPFFNKVIFLKGVQEVQPFIDNMEGLMVVIINQDFSKNLDNKKTADIELILDGRRSNSTQIVANYFSNVVNQYNFDFTREARIKQQNTQLIVRNWFNPNLIYFWYNVPCLSGILTMLVGLTVTALSVSREKELGTFDQLLVSPLSTIEILLGKMIPAIFIGVMEGSIIVIAGVFILGVPFQGSVPLLYLSLFVFVISIVGVGLFISSLANTQQQAVLGTFIFMSPSVLLSGFATPIENMPTWLQPLTYAVPLRYYLVIAKGVFLKAAPAYVLIENVWPMAIIGVFTLTASAIFFHSRLD